MSIDLYWGDRISPSAVHLFSFSFMPKWGVWLIRRVGPKQMFTLCGKIVRVSRVLELRQHNNDSMG